MGAIATFNYASWVARYPELDAVAEPTATEYFAEAGVYWRNDGTGPVPDQALQLRLLNMLTAHIAARYSQAQGSPSPGSPQNPNTPVGRINSASEGSVSAQFQNDYAPGSAQWFMQTKYGSDFWAATKAYRGMHYRASPTVVVNGAYPATPYRWPGP